MTTSIIAPIYKSIVRATSDLIDELNNLAQFPLITYHNWEQRAEESALPKNTLIGIDGFSFTENGGLWRISYGLGISSFRDENLLDEIELIDAIQQRQGEQLKIPLREMTAGSQVSELVVSAWHMLPMAQSELRNYRTIGMELLRTGA